MIGRGRLDISNILFYKGDKKTANYTVLISP
jgi:hypothetical protein